jgi:hypothetical protein
MARFKTGEDLDAKLPAVGQSDAAAASWIPTDPFSSPSLAARDCPKAWATLYSLA